MTKPGCVGKYTPFRLTNNNLTLRVDRCARHVAPADTDRMSPKDIISICIPAITVAAVALAAHVLFFVDDPAVPPSAHVEHASPADLVKTSPLSASPGTAAEPRSQRANDQQHERGGQADRTPRASRGVASDRRRRGGRPPRHPHGSASGSANWHGEGSRPTHDGAGPEQQVQLLQPGGVDRPPTPAPSTSPLPEQAGKPGDRDGDGVPNHEDKCPSKPGTNSGCPVKAPAGPTPGNKPPRVRDGDGVPNHEDKCPSKPGTDSGCPVPENARRAKAPLLP